MVARNGERLVAKLLQQARQATPILAGHPHRAEADLPLRVVQDRPTSLDVLKVRFVQLAQFGDLLKQRGEGAVGPDLELRSQCLHAEVAVQQAGVEDPHEQTGQGQGPSGRS